MCLIQKKTDPIMKKVLYPGSFDPFTNGHLDLVERASRLFDQVLVAVAINLEKNPMFSLEEREEIIRRSCSHLHNVEVVAFRGLLVDAIEIFEAQAILRGLRAFSDFEYELQMALMNRSLRNNCETVFMMPSADNSYVSSRMVKQIACFGGRFDHCVPPPAAAALQRRIAEMEAEKSL